MEPLPRTVAFLGLNLRIDNLGEYGTIQHGTIAEVRASRGLNEKKVCQFSRLNPILPSHKQKGPSDEYEFAG
jgi:hypothetical protein